MGMIRLSMFSVRSSVDKYSVGEQKRELSRTDKLAEKAAKSLHLKDRDSHAPKLKKKGISIGDEVFPEAADKTWGRWGKLHSREAILDLQDKMDNKDHLKPGHTHKTKEDKENLSGTTHKQRKPNNRT